MIIVPGVIHQQLWYTATSIPDNYLLATSKSGYNNDELTIKWIGHFQRFSAERQSGEYRLLLLDGFGSHCTKEFLAYCEVNNIVVFCLPPHSSHLLQPLDVVVFQPYKHYHSETVEVANRLGCGDFDKCEFLDGVDSISQQTFKQSTVQSAFRATGLIPYNPEVVISKLGEAVTHSPQEVLENSNSDFSIPTTIQSLKSQGGKLQNDARNMAPDFQHRLKLVLQGGLALAQSGALAMEHMDNTRAAEQARNARRRAQSRRQIQKGGVLYASEARQMVKQREEAEVKKAELQPARAQNAQKRAEQAERKVIIDGMKAEVKARGAVRAHKKRISRLIVRGIRQQGRLRNLI